MEKVSGPRLSATTSRVIDPDKNEHGLEPFSIGLINQAKLVPFRIGKYCLKSDRDSLKAFWILSVASSVAFSESCFVFGCRPNSSFPTLFGSMHGKSNGSSLFSRKVDFPAPFGPAMRRNTGASPLAMIDRISSVSPHPKRTSDGVFRPLISFEPFLKRFLPPIPPWPFPLVFHIPSCLFKNKEF